MLSADVAAIDSKATSVAPSFDSSELVRYAQLFFELASEAFRNGGKILQVREKRRERGEVTTVYI